MAMTSRGQRNRGFIYVLLTLAAVLFATPFVWLVATSLKPLEQAMTFPPTLLPHAYFAAIEGERVEVTSDFVVNQPGAVVEAVGGVAPGKRVFLSAAQVKAAAPGQWRVRHSVAAGWVHVTERGVTDRSPRWDIVPPNMIESRIRFRWENYPKALAAMSSGAGDRHVSFWRFLGNTLVVCVLGVIGTVLSNAIVGYGFARLRWRGRDAFFAITLATMMVPFPVLMVPLYGVFRHLGWIGTLLPLWVPAWFGSAFNIFLFRQFFRRIPMELTEAARIDGCSEWTIFWRVVLPLSKPVIATAALLHFLYAWNDFVGPLLYLTRKETFTLSLALQSYLSQNGGVQWHYLMAASAVTVAPVIALFFFAQRTFIQGIATTGTKG